MFLSPLKTSRALVMGQPLHRIRKPQLTAKDKVTVMRTSRLDPRKNTAMSSTHFRQDPLSPASQEGHNSEFLHPSSGGDRD